MKIQVNADSTLMYIDNIRNWQFVTRKKHKVWACMHGASKLRAAVKRMDGSVKFIEACRFGNQRVYLYDYTGLVVCSPEYVDSNFTRVNGMPADFVKRSMDVKNSGLTDWICLVEKESTFDERAIFVPASKLPSEREFNIGNSNCTIPSRSTIDKLGLIGIFITCIFRDGMMDYNSMRIWNPSKFAVYFSMTAFPKIVPDDIRIKETFNPEKDIQDISPKASNLRYMNTNVVNKMMELAKKYEKEYSIKNVRCTSKSCAGETYSIQVGDNGKMYVGISCNGQKIALGVDSAEASRPKFSTTGKSFISNEGEKLFKTCLKYICGK